MATRHPNKITNEIDLKRLAEIKNFRIHNVTSIERSVLGGELGPANIGLTVYDTDKKALLTWTGTQFKENDIDKFFIQQGTTPQTEVRAPDNEPYIVYVVNGEFVQPYIWEPV